MSNERKTERDKALVKDYLAGPITLKELGQKYGLTRERVRQLLNRCGVTGRYDIVRPRQFDPDALVERYKSSRLNVVQVSREFGCSNTTVENALKRAGVPVDLSRTERRSIVRPNRAIKMYESGKTCAQIARTLGCSTMTVSTTLRREGQVMRGPGKVGPKRPWTNSETEQMITLRSKGYTQDRIATILGRSQVTVSLKLHKLASMQ